MKLNNKGFAITGILYGLLILFALLVGSYLTILTAKKNRLDGIVENIEDEYNGNITNTHTLTFEKGTGVKAIYYSKDLGEYIEYNKPFSVEDVEILYYYVEPSEGYTTSCTKNSTCSIEINGESKKIKIDASVAKYKLTINRGTGVSKIYYKINGASSYSSTTSSSIDLAVQTGTTYYYYGTASTGYTMNSCTSSSLCSGTMGTSAVTKTLTASQLTSYTVTIKKSLDSGAATTLETASVSSNGSYSLVVAGGPWYTFDSVSCTNGQTATITEKYSGGSQVDGIFKITNVTSNTVCTVYVSS